MNRPEICASDHDLLIATGRDQLIADPRDVVLFGGQVLGLYMLWAV